MLQMKQTQPSDNGSCPPVLALEVRNGEWWLQHARLARSGASTSEPSGRLPPETGVWVRMALDVTYSQDGDEGSVKLYLDLNGDGDSLDPDEQIPAFTTHTLKYETPDPAAARHRRPGARGFDPLPSADRPLPRLVLDCPAPSGCSVAGGQRAGRSARSSFAIAPVKLGG